MTYSPKELNRRRYLLTIVILLCIFLILLGRLIYLQIHKGTHFYNIAKQQSSYTVVYNNAPRGIIYDSDNKVLASNRNEFILTVIPKILYEQNNPNNIKRILSKILNIKYSKLSKILDSLNRKDSKPKVILTNLTLEEIALIYEYQHKLPGILLQNQAIRHYTYDNVLAHIIGYTGKINAKELNKNPQYNIQDYIGKYGLEKVLDKTLRGQGQERRIKINRYGQLIEDYQHLQNNGQNIYSGYDIQLTVDIDLQKIVSEELDKAKINGAAVVINPKNGNILALSSKPDFNPNDFAQGISPKVWNQLNKKKAFNNKSIQGYPPGSIWKTITTLTALETGIATPESKFWVSGAYYMKGYRFGDWTTKQEVMDLAKALAWSRDTAYYRMTDYTKPNHMTVDEINSWADKLGAAKYTGLELSNEEKGLIPTKEWRETKLSFWPAGSTLHYSIGQGYVLMTPAQAARLAGFWANYGSLPRLHLLNTINKKPVYHQNELSQDIKLTPKHFNYVRNAMKQCVDTGTCQGAKIYSIPSAGKTGSAEHPHSKKTHSWYIGFAPFEKPEIALVVFAESAGHGGTISAPIAKKIYKAYFKKHRKDFEKTELKAEQEYWRTWRRR